MVANLVIAVTLFVEGDVVVRGKALTNILLNVFIVMTLVISSMNVQRRAKKGNHNHKLIMLKPMNRCYSWHILIMQRRWNQKAFFFPELDSLEVDEYTEPDCLEMDECTMELLLMAHVEKAPDETTWFLDSGCSNHMSYTKIFFSELDESFRKTVKLDDNSSIDM